LPPPESKPSRTPRAGDRLGEWRLEQFLARGGLGQVFLATRGGERGALKILHPELSQRPGFDALFKQEMRALMRLDPHPHLVAILDSDRDLAFGCQFFVMPYVEGVTLERHLAEKGALSEEAARRLFAGLADGLACAHERRVQHRDIKPANIIVQADGTAVLIDWGLSGLGGVAGHTLTAGYTALFVAPEVFRTGRPDPDGKSDVYCLAASLYFAVLYAETTRRATFKAKLAPEGLRELLEQALDNDPAERPTARELLQALTTPVATQAPGAGAGAAQARRASEGEALLARRSREILDRTRGNPMPDDKAALVQLCQEHGIPQERANAIVREERRRWEEAHPAVKERQPGAVEKVSLGGGVEMRFAWCPPGTFLMGSPAGEESRSNDETQHRVTLTKGYWLGVTPVTQAQWQAAMGSNPSHFKGNDRPVERVSWEDCQELCKKLGAKLGKRFRLPTEAEWEYACRAGTTTPFHFGETISTDQANYNGNYTYGKGKKGTYRQQTTPVGSFPANAWGLHDMHGNVWEWCQDWYGPYGDLKETDPVRMDKGSHDARVVRGGTWCNRPVWCRAADRGWNAPARRYSNYGCRVVLCLD
jgi:eukaryotic-like serine/threonine-protein kinase